MTGANKPAPPFRFQLDLRSGVPVYRQIIDQVLIAVASGIVTGGDQLPTVRQLAVDLSINPNTKTRGDNMQPFIASARSRGSVTPESQLISSVGTALFFVSLVVALTLAT